MEGYYTNYEGCVVLYENQMWLSDKMLAKIIDDIMLDNLENIPNVYKLPEAEINLPFRAPFNKNKRFPEVGKYFRVGPGTVWYKLFYKLHIHKLHFDNKERKQHNLNVACEMMTQFQNENDMIDRPLFEKTNKILWKNELNIQSTVKENGYYTPYEGVMFLHERQIWISDKILSKILNEILCNKRDTRPDFSMPAMTEKNLPFRAPFAENKRFPPTGKYVRVDNKSNWKTELTVAWFYNSTKMIMSYFRKGVNVFNRQSFEATMKIKWISKPSPDTETKNDSNIQYNAHDVD